MIECNTPLEALNEAKRQMPMDRLFAHYGMSDFTDAQRKKKAVCPWCGKEGKLGIKWKDDSYWLFKCFYQGCAANMRAEGKDELGFFCLKEGLPRKGSDAFQRYLDLAGVCIIKPGDKPKRRAKKAAEANQGDPAGGTPPPKEPGDGTEKPQDPDSQANLAALFRPQTQDGPGEDEPPPDYPTPPPAAGSRRNVFEAFLSKTTLSAEDRAHLKTARGFSDETIDRLQFRSNTRRNEVALNALTTEFSMPELLRSGLFKLVHGKPEIETQFMGWGLEKKWKDASGKKHEKWNWTNRPLIPYLDANGRPFAIRPHKGNIPNRDKDDDDVCMGHVYCPWLLTITLQDGHHLVVITESEYKAAALMQCGIPAIGIPGISFVRNPAFRRELVSVLSRFRVNEAVIVFDNEDKSSPKFPESFQPDPKRRYDVITYARYMAWDLLKTPKPPELSAVRIGKLPDSWRVNAAGEEIAKIDWDTALAAFVRKAGGDVRRGTKEAALEFEKVIDAALPSNESPTLFDTAAEKIVERALNNFFHTPRLASGGKHEERLARRFDRIVKKDEDDPDEVIGLARSMSRAFRAVVGCYYVRKKPGEKLYGKLRNMREKVRKKISEIEDDPTKDDALSALRRENALFGECLEGKPEEISNFIARCEYVLHTIDGKTEKLIRFENTQGERTGLLRVPGLDHSRLGEFRTFCNTFTKNVAVWFGAEKALQDWVLDMKYSSAYSDVYQVPHYGLDLKSGIWFFGDVAYGPDCSTICPDENNFFWFNGVGYLLDSDPEELGKGKDQGAPLLAPKSYPKVKDDAPLAEFFDTWLNEIYSATGGYDGLLCVGTFLGYAAAPEVYRDEGCHPGPWVFGKRGGGKNTAGRWFMRIFGFNDVNGVRLDEGTTAVSMQRAISQYSFLPFWFDEYRRGIDAKREGVIRGAFDRNLTSKGKMDGGMTNETRQFKALTTPFITGESSSNDAATRSRYAHLLMATSRRDKVGEKERFNKLQAMSRELHRIGRFLMENRADFSARTLKRLRDWVSLQEVIDKIFERRTRVVHGLGYAALLAFTDMLGIKLDEEQFKSFLVEHSEQALGDVLEETMINKFWSALISGIQREEINKPFFRITDVQINPDGSLVHEKHKFELNGRQAFKAIYIAAQPVFDMYAQDIRRSGLDAPLSKMDIQREISKEPYWLQPPDNTTRVHRASLGDFRGACWVLRLDLFPYAQEIEDALSERSAG